MKNVSPEICRKIDQARRDQGISQTALALELGCKQPAISMFEAGDGTKLSEEMVKKLATRFGISLEERKKEGHGALLDSKILADVFLKLMEDSNLSVLEEDELDFVGIKKRDALAPRQCYVLTADEEAAHKKFLEDNGIN